MTKSKQSEMISVIVVIHDGEYYIRRCIRSIINQTYQNLEILLIDAKSIDNSGKICAAFAREDKRIKVIGSSSEDIAAGRNSGLKQAQGDYLAFVEADDWLHPDMYEYLFGNLKQYQADVACCRYFDVKTEEKISAVTDGKTVELTTKAALKALVNNDKLEAMLGNKLFKKELFDKTSFPKGSGGEVINVMTKLITKANKVISLPEPRYYQRRKPKIKSVKAQAKRVLAYCEQFKSFDDSQLKLKNRVRQQILRESNELLRIAYRKPQETKENREVLAQVWDFIKVDTKALLKLEGVHKATLRKYKYLGSISIIDKLGGRCRLSIEKWQAIFSDLIIRIRARLYPRPPKSVLNANFEELTEEDRAIYDRLHQNELDIMVEFARICDKNDLKYYLYGGTLLGAVRHKGFIPWDDDVDIVMLRSDFDKFGECCKSDLADKYFYQTCFTDPNYPRIFAKIRINDTYVREMKWDDIQLHKGIYIDILPLDEFPSGTKAGKKALYKYNLLNRVCGTADFNTLRINQRIIHAIYSLLPKSVNYKRRDRFLKKKYKTAGELVCSYGSHYRPLSKRVFKKEWFTGEEYMSFEGEKFRVPAGWKEYLIHTYGLTYNELPPIADRFSHFNPYEVEFEKEVKQRRGSSKDEKI